MQFRMLTALALAMLTASTAHAQLATAVSSSTSTGDAYAAYSVYYYDSSYVGHGMAGRIVDNSSTITPYPDMAGGASPYTSVTLNGSPTVQGFTKSSSGLGIAVTDYTGATGEPVNIYDATDTTSTGSTPIATVSSGWSNVTNLYGVVKIGSYLYAIDYDNAGGGDQSQHLCTNRSLLHCRHQNRFWYHLQSSWPSATQHQRNPLRPVLLRQL